MQQSLQGLAVHLQHWNFIIDESYTTDTGDYYFIGRFWFESKRIHGGFQWVIKDFTSKCSLLFLEEKEQQSPELTTDALTILCIPKSLYQKKEVFVNGFIRYPVEQPDKLDKWKKKIINSQRPVYLLRNSLIKTNDTLDPVTIENVYMNRNGFMIVEYLSGSGYLQVLSRNPRKVVLNYVTFHPKGFPSCHYKLKKLTLPTRIRNIVFTVNDQ